MSKQEKALYSLIPLVEFKAVLGVDDREDKLARFCLLASTYTIEQYCKRRLLLKRHFEQIDFTGDLYIPLREYPVKEVLAVYAISLVSGIDVELLENDYYRLNRESEETIPCAISLSPAVKRYRNFEAIKVVYSAGYAKGKVPPDLGTACLELAAWNMARYKGKRIGTTGNVRGQGKDGEHFEMSMPENVRSLLEPYKRRVI